MTTTALQQQQGMGVLEQVVVQGDLSKLNTQDRVMYYRQVCQSVGLNPLTKPFEYISLNGKLRLYALRDATDQLRKINGVSIVIAAREVVEDCYVVIARATDKTGRHDESIGAVPIASLKGEFRSNAMMKAETKAKRRVTLSICGLGWLDETEAENIPSAQYPTIDDKIIQGDEKSLRSLEAPTESAPPDTGAPSSESSHPLVEPPPAGADPKPSKRPCAKCGEYQSSCDRQDCPNSKTTDQMTINADQVTELGDMIRELGLSKEKVCKSAGVTSLALMVQSDYDALKPKLLEMRAKKAV
jgi:hypothetical protein